MNDKNKPAPKISSKHTTLLSHQAKLPENTQGITPAIYHTAAYQYSEPATLSELYQNKKKGLTYARTGNPGTQDLEKKLTFLEDGHGAVCFTTGMAAYSSLFFVLLEQGVHVLASQHLFANTVSLLKSYQKFGVAVDFIDMTGDDTFEKLQTAKQEKTFILLVETIANPCTQVPNWSAVQAFCKQHPNVILIVDSTLTTPFGCNPKNLGAHLIIHSLTKSIMGHSRGLGGVVIDTGLMDWAAHPAITENYQSFGKDGFLMQLRKKGLRDLGATLTAQHADLALIGLETLQMRIQKASNNAAIVAEFLSKHPDVENVYHPSLAKHPQHLIAKNHYKNMGVLLSFSLKPTLNNILNQNFTFLKNLNIIKHCSSLGDNRSLIIDVAHTIFTEIPAEEQLKMGITPQTFRLSLGIEDVEDIIDELDRAIKSSIKLSIK